MSAERLVASGLTDVGRVREANEDAFLVGDSIVAVADGMGGHLAGEVASATALEPVKALDGVEFEDGPSALAALRAAVVEANETVSRMADEDPSYRGMGTTLTAALLDGRRLHLAHVGDSRAYLLRGDRFSQLTDDHTLVQHLVDEGQITREEAATHPQRSIITRAIGVSSDIDVDALSLELDPGDQLLLCSDGLTGVLEDDHIARELAAWDDPDATVKRLVDAANDGGGPDNVTVVLLRYGGDPGTDGGGGNEGPPDRDATGPIGGPDPTAPAGDRAPVVIGTRSEGGDGDWARRLGNYGALAPPGPAAGTITDDGTSERRTGRTLARLAAILVAVIVLGGLAILGGRFLIDRSYYVGLDEEQVVIYRGLDLTVGPLELGRVFERTSLRIDDVPTWYAETLEDGITAADLGDARRIVENAPRRDGAEPADAADVGTTGDEDAPS